MIGIFIATVANTFQQAMFVVAFILLPALFLSGFIYPLDAVPRVLQIAGYVNPLRYLLITIRGVMLKRVGLEALAGQVVALVVFGAAIIGFAATRLCRWLE